MSFVFQVLRAAVARSVSVAEGKELDLTCNITTDRTDDVRPEVAWYFSRSPDSTLPGSPVLARLDRDSLVHSSPHVALSHVDARSYHLLVRDVSKENSGYYFCHVALWAPGHNRSWHKVAEARSAPASVDVTWLGECPGRGLLASGAFLPPLGYQDWSERCAFCIILAFFTSGQAYFSLERAQAGGESKAG